MDNVLGFNFSRGEQSDVLSHFSVEEISCIYISKVYIEFLLIYSSIVNNKFIKGL